MAENNELMGRSLGYERKIQPKQFEPINVSTYVKDVPPDKWGDPDWIYDLWKLLVVQTNKILVFDYRLRQELRTSDDPEERIEALEKELMENLGDFVTINISATIEEKN